MFSVGFAVTWGGTGTGSQAGSGSLNIYSPVVDAGMGFGTLPESLNYLRPFAITSQFSTSSPGQDWTNGGPKVTTFNWGFTLQYSLPYFNTHLGNINNDLVKHLIPIVEFALQTPIYNGAAAGQTTTGYFKPGVVYEADNWQIALEAVIPTTGAIGYGASVVGELHFFFDDIFPDTLGRPICPHLLGIARQESSPGVQPIPTFSVRIPVSLALALTAGSAFAHALLEKATPAVGGTVASASEIRLEFSEGVEAKFSKVSLTGPNGTAAPLGAARTESGNQAVLIVPISKPLAAGVYKVHWEAVSVDTHHTQGTFKFTVKP
jgi:methionine-rich copper-binding protein CopC